MLACALQRERLSKESPDDDALGARVAFFEPQEPRKYGVAPDGRVLNRQTKPRGPPRSGFAGSSDVDLFLVGARSGAEALETVERVYRTIKHNFLGSVIAVTTGSAVGRHQILNTASSDRLLLNE